MNVVFIAHNRAKFDFMPIFRVLNEGQYSYDKSIPVSASGKMTKFKFWDQFDTTYSLWGLRSYYTQSTYRTRIQKSYSVWDSNYFLTGSLANLLKSYNIKNGKLDFNHEKVQKAYSDSRRLTRLKGNKAGYEMWEDFLLELAPKLREMSLH